MPAVAPTLVNNCTIVYDIDEQKYLFVSPDIFDIAGIHSHELIGDDKLWYKLINNGQAEGIREQINSLVINDTIELNYQITTPQGAVKNIVDKRSLYADAINGHKVLLSVIAERGGIEIKNAAQKLDSFIESITDSFIILNNDWRFVRVNSAFEKISNRLRDEMLGKIFWEVFPSIMNSGFGHTYYDAIKKHESVKFIEYFAPLNRWFSTSVYPSADGTTIFVKDITHERRAQEEAVITKNSLEALINNTHDQIWSVDTEMRYVYLNEAYVKQISHITGIEPKEGNYTYINSGHSQSVIDTWKQYYRRALSGEQYTVTSESIDLLTRQPLFFEVSFNPIYTPNGEIIGVGCFARNITLWLKTEQELIDQNLRLRNIASLSSHEIRRPVASMMGLISIMDRDNFFNPENQEIIEHLLTVSAEIDDVIRLIVDNTFTGQE